MIEIYPVTVMSIIFKKKKKTKKKEKKRKQLPERFGYFKNVVGYTNWEAYRKTLSILSK